MLALVRFQLTRRLRLQRLAERGGGRGVTDAERRLFDTSTTPILTASARSSTRTEQTTAAAPMANADEAQVSKKCVRLIYAHTRAIARACRDKDERRLMKKASDGEKNVINFLFRFCLLPS